MTLNSSRTRYTSSLRSDLFELIGSMRFAVSLLMFICVASVLGTVLIQNRASNTYIDQFGPFWFEVFDKFSIWHVYNSWWFLLIMAFLVVSTSICLTRNTPKMLRDARSFREHVRASSLRAFPHKVDGFANEAPESAARGIEALLKKMGYAVRQKQDGEGVLLAAKKGSANRLGYICAHAAMVIICVGGLLDSELPVRLQVWLGGKLPIVENMLISDVPASGRLSVDNPSFRSSVLIPEGSRVTSAVVMVDDGALVQPLPFTLRLNKFIVDYYSTGMPSRFASEVEVTDPDTGKSFDTVIEVNEPLRFKGVTVYQSSFDDGGSTVAMVGHPLVGTAASTFDVKGTVGQMAEVQADTPLGEQSMKVEITGLRPINVEDFTTGAQGPSLGFGQHVAAVTGSAAGKNNDHLRNVGPSVEYRMFDSAGQAHEFHNYMLPALVDDNMVFLAGVRNSEAEQYRYLRIPADETMSVNEFMLLRAALADPAVRAEAAKRFATRTAGDSPNAQALETAADRALTTFSEGGLQGIAGFLQTNTPPAELERAADIVIRLIGSSMGELRSLARERANLPALAQDNESLERAAEWQRLAVAALSDLTLYPAPVFFGLSDFQHKQASVFQVARTPGKNIVYFGCLLLVLGVFSMFYIRDRRVWVWIRPAQGDHLGQTHVQAAMTSQKRTLDFNREFERFRHAISRQLKS